MSILRSINPRRARACLLATAFVVAGCSGENPSDPGPLPAQYGSLVVSIGGLPNGAPASVTVTGPGGFSRAVTSTTTLTALGAGTYTLAVTDVTLDGSLYTGSPATQTVAVTAGATVNAPSVSYVLASGSLSITLSGLPQSAATPIVVSGPDGYSRTVGVATDIVGLKPGTYSVEGREVQLTTATYAASPGTQQVEVVASLASSVAHVAYAIASGSILLNISGLPQGANAAVTITGPGSYSASFTVETSVDNLAPGTYTVTAANVTSGSLFVPLHPSQQVAVTASHQAEPVNVIYVSTGTSLNVQISGLPGNVPGAVTVSGPNGYSTQLTSSQLLTGITAGSYTVTASAVSATCTTFAPSPSTVAVSVTAGQASSASISYATTAAGLNLCIDGAYITQAVQSYDNIVPLVAGRNALLRVFVRASSANSAQPSVRVRFYNNSGALVNTVMISAPLASVPTTIDEASLGASWNAQLSGALLQPGLRMLVDVDPTNAVVEGTETDNMLPANGSPGGLDVRTVSPLNVRLVPIIQAARGDTGRVDESNKADFILPLQRMFPVAAIDADIRAPYTFNGSELGSSGANWITLLSELNAVRIAEASGRMYYGVVRVGYSSGAAGLGYIGLPAAMGWDYQPSGAEVMAHELGHNFGRLHAPCGGPSQVDGAYPYSGANIGVFGYDIYSGQAKAPVLRDLMSYCDPPWISDYTYKAILNFRATYYPMIASAQTGATQRGLLVWGRIEQGRLVLEPGFEVDAPASLPARSGPHRIEGLGASGQTLFSLAFAGDRIADSQDPGDQTFAFVVPLSQLRGVGLDRIRLSALGRQVEQRGSGGGAIPSAVRTAQGRIRVSWNAQAARMALIRDARSGQILSFGRGGAVDLPAASDDLDITLSDGVKSVRSRIRPK